MLLGGPRVGQRSVCSGPPPIGTSPPAGLGAPPAGREKRMGELRGVSVVAGF